MRHTSRRHPGPCSSSAQIPVSVPSSLDLLRLRLVKSSLILQQAATIQWLHLWLRLLSALLRRSAWHRRAGPCS